MSGRARVMRAAVVAALPRRLQQLTIFGINRRARLVRLVVVASLVLFVAVLAMPVRLWLTQQNEIDRATAQLSELEASNERLAAEVEELSSPRAVEREARDAFGWVFEGEESYVVPPKPAPMIDLIDTWPFNQVSDALAGAAARRSASHR